MFDAHGKRITVERLRSLLSGLEPDLLLEANAVGNLAITDADGDYVGFVDLGVEDVLRLDDAGDDEDAV